MFYQKLIAVSLALALVMTTLAGCEKSAGKTSQSAGTADSNMVGNMYKTGLPIVKDKVTFKMYAQKDTRMKEFNQMDVFKNLEEKTNIHIEWDLEETTGGGQKRNLILASGQLPDAIYMGLTGAEVEKYYKDGLFVKLDDLINQYGTNIKKAFEQRPLYKKLSTHVDGSIYSLGSANEDECHYNPDQMFMYKPWLDKLKLPVPSTMDELYTTLKAFKEKDPNGNGKADEIPFSFRNGSQIQGMHDLFTPFGRTDLVSNDKIPDQRDHFVIENGKVVFTADKQEYKDAIQYLNKFFKEGLLDKEGFVQDQTQYFAKGKAQEVILGSFMLWSAQNMAGPQRAPDYIPVPPLKGPSGKQLWTKYNYNTGNIYGTTFAITKACKNPEILMRWVDQMYEKKTAAQFFYGAIGVTLKEGANGVLEFNQVPNGLSYDEFRYGNCPVWAPGALFGEDFGKVIQIPAQNITHLDITKKIYEPYMKSETLPDMRFTEEESAWNSVTGNDIQTYVLGKRAKWLLDGGIENEWNDYLAKLKQLKIDEHVKKMQGAYDRFNK